MRVLIADDHEPVRRGLRALLSVLENFDVCGEAVDGKEAIAKAYELSPDVIVMDFSMPVMDGIQASREIRRILPKTQIIMLSQYEAPEIMREAFGAGVDTYVTKTAIWPKLVPALRKVQQSDRSVDDELVQNVETNIKESIEQTLALEKSMRDTEERFRATFEQSAVGLAHVAPDGRWMRVNQRLCEMIGYSSTEIENLTVYDITHPADLAVDLKLAQDLASGKRDHYSIEKRLIHKNGRVVPIRLTVDAVRSREGALKYNVRVVEDNRAPSAATENGAAADGDSKFSDAYLGLISRRLDVPLARCGRDLRYVWVNEHYANRFHLPAGEILGQLIRDVIGDEAFEQLKPRFEQALRGEDVEFETDVCYVRIGTRHISATYKPTRDADGVPDGWVAFVQDLGGDAAEQSKQH